MILNRIFQNVKTFNNINLHLFTVCAILAPTFAFYEKGDVVELTASNFDRLVIQSDEIWVVEVSLKFLNKNQLSTSL